LQNNQKIEEKKETQSVQPGQPQPATVVVTDPRVAEKPVDSRFRRRGDSGRDGLEGGLEEIVIKIKRVSKTVKGGKRMSFTALVAVGDRHGRVGYGNGNAKEVPFAVEKAVKDAKKRLMSVPMKDTTLPHRTWGKYGATKVIIRPACRGTGIIASSTVRAIIELAGIKDILAKVMGSTNPTNVVKATLDALSHVKSFRDRKLLLSVASPAHSGAAGKN